MHLSHQRTVFGNSQNSLEAEASGRKELPADLFTGVYSTSASHPAWRMGPHHGMVYRMQYPVMMQPATYGAVKQSSPTFHTPVSTNPFDLGNESASAPNPVINPSATLQAVAPNNPLSLTNSSNFAAVPSQWMPQQQFPYPPSAFPGPYMMQQFPLDMPRQSSSNFFPAVNQGGVGSEAIPSGVSNSGQPPARTNSSVQSTGGNPFG
ncbi:hypothetical protein KSP40_PGU015050 [Platanthera guangdongensis]|uniref:ADP-ribosylation factor GTPase-activating protein AGD14 n=1 Tax=Platanthera guangdongensis TaxID=2320717 RepID=A0ABR2LGT5_9ASPA